MYCISRWSRPLAVCCAMTLLALLPGCDDGGNGIGAAGRVRVEAELSGEQVVPAANNDGGGSAILQFDRDTNTPEVKVHLSGIRRDEVTSVTIHAGAAGATGPVLFTFFTHADGLRFDRDADLELTEANFTPQPGAGITTVEEAVAAIEAGSAYIEISTGTPPAAQVRGQFEPIATPL